jgi:hypothetical protein
MSHKAALCCRANIVGVTADYDSYVVKIELHMRFGVLLTLNFRVGWEWRTK